MKYQKCFYSIISILVAAAFVLTACGSTTSTTVPQSPTSVPNTAVPPTVAPTQPTVIKVGFFLPDKKTQRYDAKDYPFFKAKLAAICPTCELIYSNVDGDQAAQLSAVQAAVANGVNVIVLDVVDSNAGAVAADYAGKAGIPVLAYGRPINNSKYVSANLQVALADIGIKQASDLVEALTAKGLTKPNIVMVNGGPADGNSAIIKNGALSIFQPLVDAGKLTILQSVDTPDWDPNKAQTEMQQILTASTGTTIDGIYVMNDGMAGGVIAALNAAAINPMPPVTGLDCELAAVQRILSGQQLESVYIPIEPQAEIAAQVAYALATTGKVPPDLTKGTINNGVIDIPNVVVPVYGVNKTNIKSILIDSGFWTVDQICTADFNAACVAAGLK
jgi:D-xylose transport system substrate-binding protein